MISPGRMMAEAKRDDAQDNAVARLKFTTVQDEGRLRIVTINRPDVMNALPSEACHELAGIWDEFAVRDDLWVAILTGAGNRAFCAGNDLKALAQAGGKRSPRPPSGFGGITSRFDLNKPVIAAVNGVAAGGGFEIALACDLIVASANATFMLSEVRIGVVATKAGGIHRLARMIPQKQALGMILTGRRVTAQEGRELGFVNEVVPEGEALGGAKRWAAAILECSPMAVRGAKEAFYRGLDEPSLAQAMASSYPAQEANLRSEDYVEGPKAFAEKRKPQWRNR
jgi:crotonobetainyl-CoA hydratase